jgi:hypothetical protein
LEWDQLSFLAEPEIYLVQFFFMSFGSGQLFFLDNLDIGNYL